MENPSYALQEGFILKGEKNYFNFQFLNKGGYGITYLANAYYFDGNIKQKGTYAIKEYFPNGIAQRNADGSVSAIDSKTKEYYESYSEFEQEGDMIHDLKHPGIVPVNELIRTNGTIYYVMSYLGKTSLKNYVVEQGGKLKEDEAISIMHELLDAVTFLHDKQLNHLDIKPDNVMMGENVDGTLHPVLIDFGLSKHFKPNGKQTSRLGGKGVTDGYSPLEQYAGISTFSPKADIYALGATLFYMLTGNIPEKANEISEEWIRKSLPKDVTIKTADAICNAMQRDVDKRTAKAELFFGGKSSGGGTRRLGGEGDKPKSPKLPYMKIGIGLGALILLLLLWSPLKNMFTSTPQPTIIETGGQGGNAEITETAETNTNGTSGQEQPGKPATGSNTSTGNNTSTDEPSNTGNNTSTSNNTSTGNNSSTGNNTSTGNSSTGNHSNTTSTTGNTSSSNTPTGNTATGGHQNNNDKPVVTSGTKNLGYAIYEGELKNGQPDGKGTLTFQSSHALDSRTDKQANPGDVVNGSFSNGHLVRGTWTKTDGSSEKVLIGQ